MKTYLVGGSVRDQQLGADPADHDYVVVGETPESMKERGFIEVGADFPVFLHPETSDEYALAATVRRSSANNKEYEFSKDVTIEQDLERRDLTINAMAIDCESGKLIDPFNGRRDLHNKLLRHTNSESFQDDPIRVLRLARFAARNEKGKDKHHAWSIHQSTIDLARKMARSGDMDNLVGERVYKELSRALCEEKPAAFITVMRECETLKPVFPELDALFGVRQNKHAHPEIDSGVHTLMVLDQTAKITDSLGARFSALVHDLGKGITPKSEWPKHIGHEKNGVPLVQDFCRRLKTPKDIEKTAVLATRYHLNIHKSHELKATTLVKLINTLSDKNKPKQLEDILLCSKGDAKGRKGFENTPYPQKEYIEQALEAINTVDKREIGQRHKGDGEKIKNEIYREQVSALKRSGIFRNEKYKAPSMTM